MFCLCHPDRHQKALVWKVMDVINEEAALQGFPARDGMSQRDANTCYFRGEGGIAKVVPERTANGRKRELAKAKLGTVIKFLHKKRGA